MVAIVDVLLDTAGTDTAPGTVTNITTGGGLGPPNMRFKTADNATIDTLNPIPIPAAGTNRSFWKQIYIEVTGGTFTQIDNVKFYTDGTGFGTGITTYVGDELPTHNSGSDAGYEVATGTVGTTGDELVANHGGITGKTDAFSYTSGSPKSPGNSLTISETGNIINATGESTNYWVFQMDVGTTASPGDLPDETWTFQYDEI